MRKSLVEYVCLCRACSAYCRSQMLFISKVEKWISYLLMFLVVPLGFGGLWNYWLCILAIVLGGMLYVLDYLLGVGREAYSEFLEKYIVAEAKTVNILNSGFDLPTLREYLDEYLDEYPDEYTSLPILRENEYYEVCKRYMPLVIEQTAKQFGEKELFK